MAKEPIKTHPAIGQTVRIQPHCTHPIARAYRGELAVIHAVWQIHDRQMLTVQCIRSYVVITGLFWLEVTTIEGIAFDCR
jgi:hypothetical protein